MMLPNGELSPNYAWKYPAYTKMHDAFYKYWNKDFADSDGVSDYSYEYWKGYKANNISYELAVHETLAEMARIKYETGKFPTHMGDRIMSYRSYAGTPSAAKIEEGQKRWRNLFRTVEDVYKQGADLRKHLARL